MKSENFLPCFVFPMGIEAAPFLQRLEVVSQKRIGKAAYRAAFFEGAPLLVVRCGIGPVRAAASIRNLENKPLWIISVGTAGALVDSLKVGDVVISSEAVCPQAHGQSYNADSALLDLTCRAALKAGARFTVGRVASVDRPVFTRKAREKLASNTAAIAVDMESYWIAEEAYRIAAPFTAVRVISDAMNAPPLPEYTELSALLRSPFRLVASIPRYLRWRAFLRDFRAAINELPPVLVEILRCWNG